MKLYLKTRAQLSTKVRRSQGHSEWVDTGKRIAYVSTTNCQVSTMYLAVELLAAILFLFVLLPPPLPHFL